MAIEINNIKDLVADITATKKTRKAEPTKYLIFKPDDVLEIDGHQIPMATEGFKLLAETFGSYSNTELAKKIVAFVWRLHQQSKNTQNVKKQKA